MKHSISFVRIPIEGSPVGGLVLHFDSVTSLDEFFAAVENFFTSPGGAKGSLHVSLKGDGREPAEFMFLVSAPALTGEFVVSGADPELPALFREAIESQSQYFILGVAKPIEELSWTDVEDRYLYRSAAMINGEFVSSFGDRNSRSVIDPVKVFFKGGHSGT